MYAVIKAGGKQERVRAGEVIEVEFMHADPGSPVEFKPLMIMDDEGKPHFGKDLAKAKVVARLLGDKKGEKVKVFKYRPKSGYRRNQGHRQLMTLLEIEEVALSPDKVDRKPAEEEAPAEKPAAKKAPAKKAPAKKAAAKKAAAKKTASKKTASKKTASKKPTAKKTAAKKASAKKSTTKKSTTKKKT